MQAQVEEDDDKDSPSFRLESSPERISGLKEDDDDDKSNYCNSDEIKDDDDDSDFSFAPCNVPAEAADPSLIAAADDIFSDGKIRTVYPVFNRSLLSDEVSYSNSDLRKRQEQAQVSSISSSSRSAAAVPVRLSLRRLFIEEEREQGSSFSSSSSASSTSSSSMMDDLDGIPAGTYCVWRPPSAAIANTDGCKKSSSTGTSSLKWRLSLRDLVVGRSHSDGKHKLFFVPVRNQNHNQLSKSKSKEEEEGGGGKAVRAKLK